VHWSRRQSATTTGTALGGHWESIPCRTSLFCSRAVFLSCHRQQQASHTISNTKVGVQQGTVRSGFSPACTCTTSAGNCLASFERAGLTWDDSRLAFLQGIKCTSNRSVCARRCYRLLQHATGIRCLESSFNSAAKFGSSHSVQPVGNSKPLRGAVVPHL
jgi:hypothetical protein